MKRSKVDLLIDGASSLDEFAQVMGLEISIESDQPGITGQRMTTLFKRAIKYGALYQERKGGNSDKGTETGSGSTSST